jgi:predicted DNA-binding transcriptional regulator YafY
MPFVESGYHIDVWIDMPIVQAQKSFAGWRVAATADESGTTLRCGWDNLDMFAAMLLGTGRRIIVREPQELKETFATLAQRALQAAETTTVQHLMS